MPTSFVGAESYLAVDLGSVFTRACLFDLVDNQYRFIAGGFAPSTFQAPFRDIGECFHQALQDLQRICGRIILDQNANLIVPSNSEDGSGIDRLVVTFSGGSELRVVVAGLLDEVSLQSARRLAATVGARVVEALGFSDSRSPEMQIDALLAAKPDLVILAGGTERGANRSVLKTAEILAFVCQILANGKKPEILYVGNSALAKRLKEGMSRFAKIEVAPNIRPTVDAENLGPAQEVLAQVITRIRSEQVGGFQGLAGFGSAPMMPTSLAYGRLIRYLSYLYDPTRGVMGVDLGANSTTTAAAISGKLMLNVAPLGMGANISQILCNSTIQEISQWIALDIPEDVIRDYIQQKSLYPSAVPDSLETAAIEQAIARQTLRLVMRQMQSTWPGIPFAYEPYLASGSVLTRGVSHTTSLLTLLDGLQPVGITTLVLDQNGLIPALGAIARLNSLLPVQVLESGAFMSLGTVIAPLSSSRVGAKILRARLEYEQGGETAYDILQGTITLLPLPAGQMARIHLETLGRTELDPFGKHRTTSFKVVGGTCGVIIDARGRPLTLPSDAGRRREWLNKWTSSLE